MSSICAPTISTFRFSRSGKEQVDMYRFISNTVHITMCFFVTIPLSHLAIDASESLGKRYHYQQNGPQHYYLLDTLVINHQGTRMAKGGED